MSSLFTAGHSLDRSVGLISDWVDDPNAGRGEALTWHRVTKVCEELGEVAVEYAACQFGAGDEAALRAELLDVAFSALGALYHLGYTRDLAGALHRAQVVRCRLLDVDPGDTLGEAVRSGARKRFRGPDAYFATLVASCGNATTKLLGMSGQNPRKGVYATTVELHDALLAVALDACEMLSHRRGFYLFEPVDDLAALGARLVVRAGIGS